MRLSLVRSLAIVFALPVFAHAHLLLGFFASDPIYRLGNLGSSTPGIFPGQPNIDPNLGFVDQALTTRAMHLLFSGHIPWWNSLEGFGTPLAGEMQSSALFPLSPLVLLPNGNLILSIFLSIIAGVGMLLLLRKVGLHAWPALVGAVAFELCGTFSWMSGSWTYPIPWLPLLAYGIEIARFPDRRRTRGIALVAVSLAALIYSGFIETAYLEGLVGVGWAIARIPNGSLRERAAYFGCLLLGATIGLAVSAPLLDALAQTLKISFLGSHDALGNGAALPPAALLQKFLPYNFGPIFASHQYDVASIWGNTGGYVGFLLGVLALTGCFGRRFAGIRILAALVVVFGFAAEFGGPLQFLLLHIPGLKVIAYYRYSSPSIAFGTAILAAVAIDDMLALGLVGGRLFAGLALGLGILAYARIESAQTIAAVASVDVDLTGWHVFSRYTLIVECVLLVISLLVANVKFRATLLGIAVCLEALVFLVIPTLSTPSSATIALGGMHYLQQHQGLGRMYSLGPLQPNYGSYFDVAYLNYNDLPIPSRSVTYIRTHLDALADPIYYLPNRTRSISDQRANFARNLTAFEKAGVNYVITAPNDPTPAPGTMMKYRDAEMSIYALPAPAPYFSAPGCRIDSRNRERLSASCDRPSTLCRLELNEPGWVADVDGRRIAPSVCGDIFQSIRLPMGTSQIAFHYEPPGIALCSIVAALGLIGLSVVFATATLRGVLTRSLIARPEHS